MISERTRFSLVPGHRAGAWTAISLTGLCSAVFITILAGQNTAADAFQKTVQPFLAGHCYTCHSGAAAIADLNLAAFTSEAAADAKPEIWEKVLAKLKAGKMPPAGQPVPSSADVAAVTGWIDGVLAHANRNSGKGTVSAKESDPGRVTARRLNRVEYGNTIRDLLGVSARLTGDFPVDDSGYGFDNNGDVLSLSPLLMEKYMTAAGTISQRAVYGESVPLKPSRLIRLLNRRSPDADDVLSEGNAGIYLPYSLRGAMYANWTFPVDAEYEFRLRIANFRGDTEGADASPEEKARLAAERKKTANEALQQRLKERALGIAPKEPTAEELKARDEAARKAAPPRKLILSVDGAPVLTDVIEGNGAFGYSRGEIVSRAKVKAGEHFLRASFPELADLKNPLENINPDMRRGLFVDYLEDRRAVRSEHRSPGELQEDFHLRQRTQRTNGAMRQENSFQPDGACLPPSGDRTGTGVEAQPGGSGPEGRRLVPGRCAARIAGHSGIPGLPVPYRERPQARRGNDPLA